MIKGGTARTPDYPVDAIFVDRWSPRAMSGEEITETELMTLFEAARWAPSAYNNQPWRILYARRNSEQWPLFFNLLVETNKAWAQNAAVLLVMISKTTFDHNGKPSFTHSYDAGAAWQNLALQGFSKGYVVHGMQGFSYEQAREKLQIPVEYRVEAMAAIGMPGRTENLPAELQQRETPNDRREITKTICNGPFSF